jgi:hypothetical protein
LRTSLLPGSRRAPALGILTSSSKEEPVDFGRFVEQVQRLQVYWLLVHELAGGPS